MNSSSNASDNGPINLQPGDLITFFWDYEAKGTTMSTGDIDLSFKKNDKALVIALCPNDWIRVEYNSQIGVVPKNYTKLFQHTTPEYVQALWDYEALHLKMSSGDTDLSFKKNDIMLFISTCPNEWIRVIRKGRIGVIPLNYVKRNVTPDKIPSPEVRPLSLPPKNTPLSSSTRSSSNISSSRLSKTASMDTENSNEVRRSSSSSIVAIEERRSVSLSGPPKKAIARYENSSAKDGDLEFSKDDIVYILEQNSSGIWKGECNGQVGFFPSSYIEVVTEEPTSGSSESVKQVKWNLVNYKFVEEDSLENILFTEEKKVKVIRGATVTKLVERLTYPDYVAPNYVFEFLLTYRSFISPNDFLDLLIQRFRIPTPPETKENQELEELFFKSFVKPIHLRIFNVLKKWMEDHWEDFDDKIMLEKVRNFIDQDMRPIMEQAADTLFKLITRKLRSITLSNTIEFPKPPPESYEPDVKLLTGLSSEMHFMAFHPEEIARQLTNIEFEIYKCIKANECLSQNWTKKDKLTKSPNILKLIQRFNKVSMWVTSTLIQIDKTSSRIEALGRFIEIAERLKLMNNMNGTMEILAGLRSAAISRLKKTWTGLSSAKMKTFEELMVLMSPESNYTKLRTYLHKTIPPCIPYLGIYLSDLTFIEDGNPNNITEALINFDKRRRIASVIKEMKEYQQINYYFKDVPIIKGYLLAVGETIFDENTCYKISLQIEPRDGAKESKKKTRMSLGWRKGGSKTETISKRNMRFMEVINLQKSASSSALLTSPSFNDKKTSSKSSKPSSALTIDDLVECLIEGNGEQVEAYLESLDKPMEEKEKLRETLIQLFEERMEGRGAQRVETSESFGSEESDEYQDIPFESLIASLLEGNTVAFEAFFEGLDVFEAERIREQALKMFEEELHKRGGSKKS